MKGLKALIEEKRRAANAPSSSEQIVDEPPKRASTAAELQNLSTYYGDTTFRRKRGHEQDEDMLGGKRSTNQLRQATKTLYEHGMPLKLYGESASDIIARAAACLHQFEGTAYDAILCIDQHLHPIWGGRIVERSVDSRLYSASQKALAPLVKALQADSLDTEIRDKLYRSALHCVRQEFKQAHEAYISLAIGDAAWPMGVTMVGIHERVGRSRIAASEIKHILDNETTCKYIQVFKRLMTLCQTLHPVEDPSQMVLLSS